MRPGLRNVQLVNTIKQECIPRRLKLRATTLLAEGDNTRTFEAAVLLHDAARAEARALLSLETSSPEVRLASAIEQYACFVEGVDPMLAVKAGAWCSMPPEPSRRPPRQPYPPA